MESTDQIQPVQIQPATQYSPDATALVRGNTASVALARGVAFSFLAVLWRYRVLLAGLSAILLAILGEGLMRSTPNAPASNPELGSHLVQVAVLLVGLVAWVNEGFKIGRARTQAALTEELAFPALPLPVRPTTSLNSRAARTQRGKSRIRRGLVRNVVEAKERLGWAGVGIGLGIVAALGVLLFFLLKGSWYDPLAGWVWALMLVAMALTFTGVKPWPAGPTLLSNDPAEPIEEPPMSRGEWLAIGVIMLAAAVLRLWNLQNVPVGPYSDEGDRAIDARHLNRGEPVNREPFAFFGTGWWGVPSFYFWLVAQSMKVFGDNLFGARMVHALSGIGTVWYTYRTARLVWSPRAGLLAGALLAASDFAIQFSRTAGESTITMFTWAACFYYLYKALKTRRPLYYVLSGVAAGFTLLGYVSGKLLPVFMVGLALYLLLRWGRKGARLYLPGLVLLAIAAGLTYAPNGLYVLTQRPDAFTQRYNGVSILAPDNLAQAKAAYNTNNTVVVLANQFALTFRAFDTGKEQGPFYPTDQPILPVPWAALWVLGTAYMVWRIGDARYAILAIWLMCGLAGAALTNGTPTLQRVTGMVPLLALVPALFLDRVASGVTPNLRWRLRLPRKVVLARAGAGALLAGAALFLASQTLPYYFTTYQLQNHYFWYGVAGKYAGTLDPDHNTVYQMDLPEFNWYLGPAVFEADRVDGRDFANAIDELPLLNNKGKNANFLVFPSNDAYMPVLQSYYPGGTQQVVARPTPESGPFFTAYQAPSQLIDDQRQTAVRYGPPQGPLFEHKEPRLGTLMAAGDITTIQPPIWLTYPTQVEWSGGLIAPQYGTYRFGLSAPPGSLFEIDGRTFITLTNNLNKAEAPVVLAKGVHKVRLTGTLSSAASKVELRWSTQNGELVPIARRFLWGGPLGTWYEETSNDASDPAALSLPQLPSTGAQVTMSRRDGVLAGRAVNGPLNAPPGSLVVWKGTLRAPTSGSYAFDVNAAGLVAVFVDGKLVGARGGSGAQLPASATLTAGEHPIEVRFKPSQDGALFEFFWQPPNGPKQILPPTAMSPAQGGAWTVDERPGVASPEAATIDAVSNQALTVAATIGAGDANWSEGRGVGVLPDGRLVVGDAGKKQLVIYGADGKQQGTYNGSPPFSTIGDVDAAPDGSILVVDGDTGDLRLFDGTGAQTAEYGRVLAHSSGAAWGADGKIYVADTGSSRVLRFSKDGHLELAYHDSLNGLQTLEQPVDVVTLADGTVYAVDLRGRLVRFNQNGQIDAEWPLKVGVQRGGSHLAAWNNLIAITNPDNNSLAFFDPTSGTMRDVHIDGDADLGLSMPVGVATGPNNRLYVLDSANKRIVVLAAKP